MDVTTGTISVDVTTGTIVVDDGSGNANIFFCKNGIVVADRRDVPVAIHIETQEVVETSHDIFEPAPLDNTKNDSIKKVKNTIGGRK